MHRAPIVRLAALAGLATGCTGAGPTLASWLEAAQGHPLGLLAVLAAFLLSGFVGAPLTVVMVPTIVLLGPVAGGAVSLVGATLAAALFYQLGAGGARLGRRFGLKGIGETRLAPLLERHGIVAVVVARSLPLAPYPVVNLGFGASPVRFRDFLIGNTLGLVPWVAAYAVAGGQLRELLLAPSAGRLTAVGLLFAGVVVASAVMARVLRRRLPDHRAQLPGDSSAGDGD